MELKTPVTLMNSATTSEPSGNGSAPLVQMRDLTKTFVLGKSLVRQLLGKPPAYLRALDSVNLDISRGEALGLVGESGCGKTTLGRCILRLYEPDRGQVLYEGQDILKMKGAAMRQMRSRMQIVFQDPYSSLNPKQTIREILAEPCLVHKLCARKEVRERVDYLLNMVGLSTEVAERYPHELSGGQRQRVGLARALAVEPKFIVADEPVSALDVSIQAQVVNLLMELQEKLHLTLLFITHDLRLVHYVSHRVAVMYLGSIVELASAEELFARPAHPYTRALLAAAPKIDPRQRVIAPPAIRGEPPSPINIPAGCRFRQRCPLASERCTVEDPPLRAWDKGHFVACHNV